MAVSSRGFRVMASITQVTLVDPEAGAAEYAEARLRELEQRWSRFIDTSDVTLINQNPEAWVPVGRDTIRLIQAMQLASDATGGSFDPTFLHQLLSTGYTSSIDDPSRITLVVDVPSKDFTVHDVAIDLAASSVFVPTGLSLDPGGIGKGFAADLVVTELLDAGTGGALVSVGGDIAAAGTAPTPQGWIVNVEDPLDPPSVLTTLALSDGGITTSSTHSRRWLHQGLERHHVIDPATGTTSRTDLAAVTVVANAGWLAEAHATAALLRGSSEAIRYLQARGLSGLAVTHDGQVASTPDIQIEPVASGAAR